MTDEAFRTRFRAELARMGLTEAQWARRVLGLSEPEWVKVATICVDSGCVAVGDPGYLPWVLERRSASRDYRTGAFEVGLRESGVWIAESGYGDGGYDVFERKSRDDRTAELRVVFIPEGGERKQP